MQISALTDTKAFMPELANIIGKGTTFEECKVVDTRPVKVKSFGKTGPKTYSLVLMRDGAGFDLCAKVTIADGYPDNSCHFALTQTSSSTKKATEESKQATASDDKTLLLNEMLSQISAEVNEHTSDFCEESKFKDFLFSFQVQKLKCCFERLYQS